MTDQNTKEKAMKYLDTHVNIVIKPLLVDLIKSRTNNVCEFIKNWIDEKGMNIELNRKNREENYDRTHLPPSEDSFILEGEEEEDIIEKKIQKRNTKKKFGISGESYGDYNKLGSFKARVIEKTEEQKNQIRSILAKNFMFNALEEKQQMIVILAMDIKEFKKGDAVIKQGDDGEELYIVFSGKLKCTKKFADKEEETFLKMYESGELFGELALMYNAPRAASISAEEDSVLFSLDRGTFNHIVKAAAIERRNQYTEFLKKIDILSSLDSYERNKICDCLQTKVFKKDDTIIKEGEDGDKFYLIQEGKAVALQNKDGKEEVVFEYKENDYFGELALLSNDKRKAAIKVISDLMVVSFLSKKSFKRLLGNVEDILQRNKAKYDLYVKKDN